MKLFKKLASFLLVAVIALTIIGCNNNKNNNEQVAITFDAAKTTLSNGESTNLTVTVTGSSNTNYSFIISDPSLVKIENNVLTVIGDVTEDKAVTVVAYAAADASKTATKIFTIKNYVEPKVEITTQRNTITYGETITLSVNVVGLENKGIAWIVSDNTLVKVDNNVLSVLQEVNVDTEVTIKAVSVEKNNVYDEKKIIVKAASSFGTISITTSQDTISEGETVMVAATVTGLKEIGYTWKVSHEDLVKIENGQLILIGTVKIDTNITITATATADESVFKSKTILVKAPIIEGQVGELTNAVLAEIANSSITFGGVITDYYTDFNNSFNNSVNEYDSLVMMSDGRWYGSWNIKGNTTDIVIDNYRRGSVDGLSDAYGNVGHALERLYINKNNEVSAATVKDYQSIPAIWEAQHLWNHLGNLKVTDFVYNADDELYTYTVNQNDMEALYLMTYLSYCLTPLLEDTIASVSFKIEEGHITKVILRQKQILGGNIVQIWAPEIFFFNDSWYIYFTAAVDEGDTLQLDTSRRTYGMKSKTTDAFGEWEAPVEIKLPCDYRSIDATFLNYKGKQYIVWAGWPNKENKQYEDAIESYQKFERFIVGKLDTRDTIEKNMVLLEISRKLFTHSLPLVAAEQCYNKLLKDTRNLIVNSKTKEKKEEAYTMLLKLIEDYNVKLLSTKVYWDKPQEREAYKKFWNAYSKSKNSEEKEILILKRELTELVDNEKNNILKQYYKVKLVEFGVMKKLKAFGTLENGSYTLKKGKIKEKQTI